MKEAPPPLPLDAAVSALSDLTANRFLEVECPLAESAAPSLNDAPSTCHPAAGESRHTGFHHDHFTRTPDCPADWSDRPLVSVLVSLDALLPARSRSPLCIWPRHKHL